MSRRPQPGGDRNSWGRILNDHLSVSINEDGTIKPGGVSNAVTTEVETALSVQLGPAVAAEVAADPTVAAAAAAAVDAEPRIAQLVTDVDAASTSIARVDPGTDGAIGQVLTVGPDGPAWLEDRVFNVKHPRFGAKGDNATDDTAAIQSAINAAKASGGGVVHFPRGHYRVSSGPLIVDSNSITFRGAGITTTRLTSDTGDLFHLNNSPHNLWFESMWFTCSAGHIWKIERNLLHCNWTGVFAVQHSNTHAVLYGDHTNMNYIDNLWLHCQTTHTLSATMPTFFLKGMAVNNNRWSEMRPNNSGNYTWWIESTINGAWCYDNVFDRITGEVQKGGAIMLRGCVGTHIRDFGIWDAENVTKHLISISDSAAGNGSNQTLIQNVRTAATTLASGVYDLMIDTVYSSGTTIINCGMPTRAFKVQNNGKRVVQIGGEVDIASPTGSHIIPGTTATPQFGSPLAVRSYTNASRPSATSAGAGAMIFNSSTNRPNWSDGTSWRDAAGNTV